MPECPVSVTKKVLNASEAEVDMIITMGWLGMLLTVPIATLIKDHGKWFWIAACANVAVPIVRYFAALMANVKIVIATNFVAGMSAGIFSTWPVMLAAMWPGDERAYINAVASLSNYAGGAIAVLMIPVVAVDPGTLKFFLLVQAFFSAGPLGEASAPNALGHALRCLMGCSRLPLFTSSSPMACLVCRRCLAVVQGTSGL